MKEYDARKAPGIHSSTDVLYKTIKTELPMSEVAYIFEVKNIYILNLSIIFILIKINL